MDRQTSRAKRDSRIHLRYSTAFAPAGVIWGEEKSERILLAFPLCVEIVRSKNLYCPLLAVLRDARGRVLARFGSTVAAGGEVEAMRALEGRALRLMREVEAARREVQMGVGRRWQPRALLPWRRR